MPRAPATHGRTSARLAKPKAAKGPSLYDSQRWRRLSRLFLSQPHNALCVACKALGLTVAAEAVDHIQRHGGDHGLFWDESNWQGLCVQCHGVKTSMETRGTAAYPNLLGKPAHAVILVCGPPGSGRLTYARGQATHVLDLDTIAAQYAGTPRHQAPKAWRQAAKAEVHRQLAVMATQPVDRLVVVLDCPGHGARREWRKRLHADRVVIFEMDAEDCARAGGAEVGKLAQAWWRDYTAGHGEETVRL